MGLFDKISNLIFEDDSNDDNKSQKPASTPTKKGSWKDIFFEDASEEDHTEKKKGSFLDFLFEDEPDADIQSTFVAEDEKASVLDDISSQIKRRESELINLAEFFKTVNAQDYPDSAPEYEAYLSLIKQLNALKTLAASNQSSAISSMSNYQLESNFKKFELDYQAHIGAIQSLCYLSEISTLNDEMERLFSSHFTNQTDRRIAEIEEYITLISKKSNTFDKKYCKRLYKELIEAEYRLTLLKLMAELQRGTPPRKNPFASFPPQKKKIFETYLSKGIRDSNSKYNTIADNREKYTKYRLVSDDFFDKLDADAEVISERINKYTIDDFLLSELFDNGEGFETLKRFLAFKLNLNFIDSKTAEADKMVLDDHYRKVTSGHHVGTPTQRPSSARQSAPKPTRRYPNYDDDL